jgi:glycosyltransferase involved in cell wall biosynthesis
MAKPHTIAVCYPQVPFSTGGAELLVGSLCRELKRRDYRVEAVSVPYRWTPKDALLDQLLAWRLLDLRESNGTEIDQVIATKFPSYAVAHPNKVTWLFHQFRQTYDLFGTEYSDFTRAPGDLQVREMIRRTDCTTLSESKRLFTLSETVSKRLEKFNNLESTPLYHPPPRDDAFRVGPSENYILSVGRLESIKRIEPLVRAMAHTESSLRCVICGTGPEEEALRALAEAEGVDDRIDFRGTTSFDDLVDLYAGSLAVYFAPFEEDYGYITLEAFLSGKPVVTAPDSGGPTEFVADGETGVVVELDPEKLGEKLRTLAANPTHAEEMGRAGLELASELSWDPVIDALVIEA